MDYLSAINNRQSSQGDNEYWSNLAAGNLSSGLGNTFGDIQSNLAQSGISYESSMSSASGALSEKINAATQKSTQAAIERGELATQLMEAGGGILAAKDVAKKLPAAYQKAKSSVSKFRDSRAKSAASSKAKTTAEGQERVASGQEPTPQGADYSRSATETTENPLRHPLTAEEEPVTQMTGGETEMADLGAQVRTGEAVGHAATDVRRPAAIGEEDSGAEIARQQSSRGVGAETEMSGRGPDAERPTSGQYSRATTADAGADVSRGVGVGEDFRPTNTTLGSREVGSGDLADRVTETRADAQTTAENAGQSAYESAGGTGEIGSAAEGVSSAAEGGLAAGGEAVASGVSAAASGAAEGVGTAVGEAAAESGTAALTEMAVGGFNVVSDVVGAGMLLAGVGDALYNAFKGNEKAESHEARKEDKAKDAYAAAATSAAATQKSAQTAASTAQTAAISDYHSTMSNMAGSSHLAVTGGTEQVRNNSHAQSGTF